MLSKYTKLYSIAIISKITLSKLIPSILNTVKLVNDIKRVIDITDNVLKSFIRCNNKISSLYITTCENRC